MSVIPAVLCADNLKWLATEYDFGTIREEAGKAHGSVSFVNAGKEPTVIQRVKSTCGCTGVGYTQGLIAPGDTAVIWFDYNPTGRPGRFEKHVKAYTGIDGDLMSITIKGTVIGAPHSLDSKYPYVAGNMRLSSDVIALGRVMYGTARHEYIHGYNQSADTLHLSWDKLPKYISLGASSLDVPPGDLFTISAYVNTRDGVEIGQLDVPVVLHADFGTHTDTAAVHVTAQVEPDTSGLTVEQMRNAPVAEVFPTVLDMRQVSGKDKHVDMEFSVRNAGKSPLNIKRVHCASVPGLVTVKSMPKTLKPGQMKSVKLKVNTDKLPTGNYKIPIEVVSDDVLHPALKVYLIGTNK